MLADQAWEHFADRGIDYRVGDAIEGGGFAVDDDEARSPTHSSRHDAGDGVDLETRSDGEQEVRFIGGLLGSLEVGGDEGLAERDRGRLHDAAAFGTVGVLLTRADSLEHRIHRGAVVTRQAARFAGGAVNLDDEVWVDTAHLVQLVDILGHKRVQHTPILEGQQGSVAVVGGDVRPQCAIGAQLPVDLADVGLVHVVRNGRRLLGLGVLGPNPVWSAKIREARIGRYASAGQDRDALGLGDERTGVLDGCRVEVSAHVGRFAALRRTRRFDPGRSGHEPRGPRVGP